MENILIKIKKFNEIALTNSIPFKITRDLKENFAAEFIINENRFLVQFTEVFHGGLVMIELSFVIFDEDRELFYSDLTRKNRNQFLIFSTIVTISKIYLDKYKPDMFMYSSDKGEMSRTRLYSLFADNIEKYISEYELYEIDKTNPYDVYFIFKRRN